MVGNNCEDNHVEAGDFLVFEYSGDRKFEVIIFGKYAVGKRETSSSAGINVDVKMVEEEEEKTKNGAETDVNFEVDFDDDLGDTGYIEKDSEESEYNEKVEEEEAMENTEEEELETRNDSMCRGIIKKKHGKRARVREGSSPAAEVRKYVQCQNPYFVAKGGPGQRNLLLVPSYVLKDFDLELPEQVTFRDELGRKWSGQAIHWKDGRTCIKGWRAVCRWNHVQNDDCCICECPKRKGMKQYILVHIVRGVGSGSQT